MKIKVYESGETSFTADDEYTEPGIRGALGLEAKDRDEEVRAVIYDTTDGARDTSTDEYLIITEDDGTLLWSGWLSQHLDGKPAPGEAAPSGDDPASEAFPGLRRELDAANADRNELAHINTSQACLIRDLQASLSSLTDRAEAGRTITGDEAAEFRKLTSRPVPIPEDDPADDLLALPLPPNGSGATTVRGYLVALLTELWAAEARFSGKRPFGSSGWQADIYRPMVAAGMVSGTLDEDGYLDAVDEDAADALILAAIERLGQPS